MLVDQVPGAIERVRREIVLARFIGKLAVDQGVRELRSRLDELANSPTRRVSPIAAPVDVDADVTVVAPGAEDVADADIAEDAAVAETESGVPEADTLALSDYDQLPASDIVAKLEGLEPDERDDIERFERGNRRRRTVLGKLDQLRAAP